MPERGSVPDGTSSHLHLGRPKAVRIHTRNLMHPLMVHPETQPRSPWRTCPTKEEWVPPQTQRRRSTLVTHPSARARERRDTDGKGVTQVPLVELRPRGSRLPAAAGIVGGTRRGAFYKDCLETVFVLGLLLRSTLSLRKPGVQSVNEFNHLVSSAFLLHGGHVCAFRDLLLLSAHPSSSCHCLRQDREGASAEDILDSARLVLSAPSIVRGGGRGGR